MISSVKCYNAAVFFPQLSAAEKYPQITQNVQDEVKIDLEENFLLKT